MIYSAESDKKEVQRVSTNEFLKKVEIVGIFGKPLGTVITLNGTWGYGDDHDEEFKVFSVNETGEFRGIPIEVFEELGSIPASKSAFRFINKFNYFRYSAGTKNGKE
jgi:hypothetical protein